MLPLGVIFLEVNHVAAICSQYYRFFSPHTFQPLVLLKNQCHFLCSPIHFLSRQTNSGIHVHENLPLHSHFHSDDTLIIEPTFHERHHFVCILRHNSWHLSHKDDSVLLGNKWQCLKIVSDLLRNKSKPWNSFASYCTKGAIILIVWLRVQVKGEKRKTDCWKKGLSNMYTCWVPRLLAQREVTRKEHILCQSRQKFGKSDLCEASNMRCYQYYHWIVHWQFLCRLQGICVTIPGPQVWGVHRNSRTIRPVILSWWKALLKILFNIYLSKYQFL